MFKVNEKCWGKKVDEKGGSTGVQHWLRNQTSLGAARLTWETSAVFVNTKFGDIGPEL